MEAQRDFTCGVEFDEGPVPVDWDLAERLETTVDDLGDQSVHAARFAECPACATKARNFTTWQRELKRWIRKNETITLFRSKKHRLTSEAFETEGEFRARLQQLASEKRDQAVAKLRKRYATKATTLENRLLRAEQAIEREQQQSTQRKMDTAISFGTAILGAVLGRKRLSASTATRVGSAVRKAGSVRKEAGDVARAKQTAKKVRADIAALEKQLQQEVQNLELAYDAQDEELNEIVVRPKTTDIHIPLIGLGWVPYREADDGRLQPAHRE